MTITVEWTKEFPKKKIFVFEDKVVYNTAVFTREYTKATNAYPYRTGKLAREEIKQPIGGSNRQYYLTNGTDYDVKVWNMTNVNWTNPNTKPQWYYNQFKASTTKIIKSAINAALKEI